MGPRNSKQSYANFMRDYDIIQQNTVENITFLQHKITQDEYLLKQFNFNDKRQSQKVVEKLLQLKNKLAGNKHVVPLKDYLTSQQDQYCSTFYKVYALFQYPQRTLDDQINQRKLHKKRFNQTQLWSILASCIVGLSHLQKNGIKHSALKSNNILLSREGVIKVSDPFALGQHSNYENALTKRQSKHSYLSPQQVQSLQQQIITPNINPYKSDIWTLGVIMMQAGLLQYQDDECYRDDKMRVHWETVKYNIKRLGQIYSDQFKNMIDYMLSPDEKSRPDWLQLQDHVMKGQNQGRRSFIHQQEKQLAGLSNQTYTRNTVNKTTPLTSSNKLGSQISFQNSYNTNPNPNININTNVNMNMNMNTNTNMNVGLNTIQVVNPPPNPPTTTLPIILSNRQSQPYQQKLPVVYQQPIIPNNPVINNGINFSSYHSLGVPNVQFHPQSPRGSNQSASHLYSFTSSQPNPPISNQLFPQSSPTIINNLNQTNSRLSNNTSGINNFVGTNPSTPTLSTITPNNPSSNYNIGALKPSMIDQTRPAMNIFPSTSYTTKTKIDENIIIVTEDQLEIQSNIPKGEVKKTNDIGNVNSPNINQVHYIQQNQNIQKTFIQPNRYSSYSSPEQINGHQFINVQGKQMRPLTVITNQHSQMKQVYQQPLSQQVHHQYQPGSILPRESRSEFVTEQFRLGSRYEGYKLNGLRHGYGKFYYQDGGMYDGNWKQNKMQGLGKLYYQSGKLAYQGQWKNDQFMGKGVLYNENPEHLQQSFDYNNFDEVDQYWSKYEGQFVDDMKHGKGTLYFSNGQKFQGFFKGDIVSGPGTFYCLDGSRIQGNWVQNKKIN